MSNKYNNKYPGKGNDRSRREAKLQQILNEKAAAKGNDRSRREAKLQQILNEKAAAKEQQQQTYKSQEDYANSLYGQLLELQNLDQADPRMINRLQNQYITPIEEYVKNTEFVYRSTLHDINNYKEKMIKELGKLQDKYESQQQQRYDGGKRKSRRSKKQSRRTKKHSRN